MSIHLAKHAFSAPLKYKYSRIWMGLKCSPDIAQAIMEYVLFSIEDVDVYIDDIGAFSND
jgi:hypothetical protein